MRRSVLTACVLLVFAACSVPSTGPIALDDRVVADPGVPVQIRVLANDRPPSGTELEITDIVGAAGEVLVVEDGRSISYVGPEAGRDVFAYTVRSTDGRSTSATVTVDLVASPDPGPESDDADTDGPEPTDPPTDDSADAVPPTIEVFDVRQVARNRVSIEVIASDDVGVSLIEIGRDGEGPATSCFESQCNAELDVAEAAVSVWVSATDHAGNAQGDVEAFALDRVGPAVESIRVTPEEPGQGEEVRVEGVASDPSGVAQVLVLIDGVVRSRCDASRCEARFSMPEPGSHRVEVVATDAFGNEGRDGVDVTIVERRADLVVESFRVIGESEDPGFTDLSVVVVPVEVVVSNIGDAAAGGFGLSVHDQFQRPTVVRTTATTGEIVWYPRVEGLAPGDSVMLRLEVAFGADMSGQVELEVRLDSCAGVELAPVTCEVAEWSEDNNTSEPRSVIIRFVIR